MTHTDQLIKEQGVTSNYHDKIIGILLSVVAILIGAIWLMLTAEISDVRSDVKALQMIMADAKADIKTLISRAADMQSQNTSFIARLDDITHQINDRLDILNNSKSITIKRQ